MTPLRTAAILLFTPAPTRAEQFGTEAEARAMLERAVAAIKENKAKALEMFNKAKPASRTGTLRVLRKGN